MHQCRIASRGRRLVFAVVNAPIPAVSFLSQKVAVRGFPFIFAELLVGNALLLSVEHPSVFSVFLPAKHQGLWAGSCWRFLAPCICIGQQAVASIFPAIGRRWYPVVIQNPSAALWGIGQTAQDGSSVGANGRPVCSSSLHVFSILCLHVMTVAVILLPSPSRVRVGFAAGPLLFLPDW